MVDGALNPLIAFGLWNRTKVNAVLSNKVEHIVFESISKMKTIRAEGNAFDVSSLNNTDLCSNEALAHEMKEYAKLLNNIDTNVEFVCQDLQALWADSEHGPRVKFTGKDDAVVAGFMDRSQRHVLITQKIPRVVQRLSRSPRDSEDREDSSTDPAWSTDPARSEEGQTRPSEVRGGPQQTQRGGLRASQGPVVKGPVWSEPKEARQTQRGQSPEGHNRPSVVKGLRARQDPARSEP